MLYIYASPLYVQPRSKARKVVKIVSVRSENSDSDYLDNDDYGGHMSRNTASRVNSKVRLAILVRGGG